MAPDAAGDRFAAVVGSGRGSDGERSIEARAHPTALDGARALARAVAELKSNDDALSAAERIHQSAEEFGLLLLQGAFESGDDRSISIPLIVVLDDQDNVVGVIDVFDDGSVVLLRPDQPVYR